MIKPKKSLGQNFLRDSQVLAQIIEAADLNITDNILEIGPGEGVLTDELIKFSKKVIAIEKDDNLALRLDSRLRGNDKIIIVSDDILEINLPELIEKNNFQNYKVIANIPYYITSPIIRLFLETKYRPQELILMVQREVAERICASAGQMSILSVSVQYYATAEILFFVEKQSFWPVPEVDSAVIRITPSTPSRPSLITPPQPSPEYRGGGGAKTKDFFRIVKAGFSAKRKTLVNNLATSLHLDKKVVEEKITQLGFSLSARAQELDVEDWKKLASIL